MAEPIRERVLDAIVKRLETIIAGAGPGSGYRQTLKRVSRNEEYMDQQSAFPVAFVYPIEHGTSKVYQELDDGIIEGHMGVAIAIMAETTDATPLSTVFERLIADVEIALTTDLHLGMDAGTVEDIRDSGEFQSLYDISENGEVRSMAVVVYHIRYAYTRGAP